MAVVLNDLFDYNLKIYQDTTKFKFSLDSLLLAEFTEVTKKDQHLMDLCSGNAPIPLILASKYNITITAIELQESIFKLGQKSIAYNNLNSKISYLNMNISTSKNYFPGNNFDIITCNPPFFKTTNPTLINENPEKAIARHELTTTLEEIFEISSYHLKRLGKLYMVHRPERLEEILTLAQKYNFHAKELVFITTNENKYAIMVLLKFVKGSKSGLKVKSITITNQIQTYQNIFKRR